MMIQRSMANVALTLLFTGTLGAQSISALPGDLVISTDRLVGSTPPQLPALANPASLTPTAATEAVGVRPIAAPALLPLAIPRRNDRPNSSALMILGGGALIAGALIGHTTGYVIMIGGAAIGLYGLYHYLQ